LKYFQKILGDPGWTHKGLRVADCAGHTLGYVAGVWALARPIFFSVVGFGLGLGLDDYVTIFLRAFYVGGLWRRIRLPCNGIVSGWLW
jgi:hypothetical protein